MLLDVARELASTHEPEAILAYLVDSLTRYFSAERGFAGLTGEAGALEVRVAHNVTTGTIPDPERAVCHTITRDVARRRAPVLVRDASSDPVLREHTSVFGQGIRSVMCAPMIARGELMGVIYVDNLSKGESFSDEDLDILTLLSAYAAAALYNARLISAGPDAARVREAGEKFTALSQMAAGIGHDFKNVLWAIEGRLELLQLRTDPAAIERDIALARDAVKLGRRIVEGMSQFAELGFCGPPVLVDVGRLAAQVARLLVPTDPQTPWSLELAVARDAFVRAPEAQVRQIAMNLMKNALEAMPRGGTLSVSVKRIGTQCALRVEDTGEGIPEEIKARLFEPCFTTKGEGATGLGLSVVQAVVARLGGSVTVESAVGRGSRFCVYLPAADTSGKSA